MPVTEVMEERALKMQVPAHINASLASERPYQHGFLAELLWKNAFERFDLGQIMHHDVRPGRI